MPRVYPYTTFPAPRLRLRMPSVAQKGAKQMMQATAVPFRPLMGSRNRPLSASQGDVWGGRPTLLPRPYSLSPCLTPTPAPCYLLLPAGWELGIQVEVQGVWGQHCRWQQC